MTRPGEQFRTLAQRICGPRTMEHLIDPVVADIQREYAEAIGDGRPWRARWIWFAGWWSLLKGASLYALTEWDVGRTAMIVSTSTVLVTVPLVLVPLMNAARLIPADGIPVSWPLVMHLLPQAFAISVPVGFAVGVVSGMKPGGTTWRTRRPVLAMAFACSVASFLNVGWVAPAANQEFRALVAGRWVERGDNELTFSELRRKVNEGMPAADSGRDLPPALLSYHVRLALCVTPILMAAFSFAVAALRRRGSRWICAGLALGLFLSCYILFPPEEVALLLPWLSPAVVAWFPNMLLIVAAVSTLPLRTHATLRRAPSPKV